MPLTLIGPIKLPSSQAQCWKCKAATPVHAIMPSELVDSDEDGYGRIDESVFVYDIEEDDMPEPLADALRVQAPNYSPQYSRTQDCTVWGNACTTCGSLQGGFFLHAEPDEAFFGMPRDYSGELKQLYQTDVEVAAAAFGLG